MLKTLIHLRATFVGLLYNFNSFLYECMQDLSAPE